MADLKKIAIASDHGAFELKELLVSKLQELGYEPQDMGVNSEESVDYPDYGEKVAKAVSAGEVERGILLCGTGIGMSITANKFPNVRAALVHDHFTATMSKKHNNANILVMGARILDVDTAYEILNAWLNTEYEGGRHDRRLEKISNLEKSGILKNKV
ncbi:Ribose 5-phosphate isomerase B [hydrothermal vent metagenome]|uniref:Ribose 5-phosphate isomerase B n=1 Tax=hydrothermal vent metagenome TaxID=652676 RepID=A0A3B1CHA2_9ZZZZ